MYRLDISAAGDYADAPNLAAGNQIFGATKFSLDIWVMLRSAGASGKGRYIDKGNSTTVTIGYVLTSGDGGGSTKIVFTVGSGGGSRITTTIETVSLNVLNHIAVTWLNPNAAKVYLNGVECTYSSNDVISALGDDSAVVFNFGNSLNRLRNLNGFIYAFRTYRNVELSAAEVLTLKNAGVKAVDPLAKATAEYLFNEGQLTTLTDRIAANNATINGPVWSNVPQSALLVF
jgi:hypothetical protein